MASTSQTVAFADSGRVNWWSYPQPVLEENYYLDPPSNTYPTVHFRHTGTANVLFLDGHVETLSSNHDASKGQSRMIYGNPFYTCLLVDNMNLP